MSGSSLDGLDIAFCTFTIKALPTFEVVNWKINASNTVAYSKAWQKKLMELPQSSALDFVETHAKFGHYLGQLVQQFLSEHALTPDLIVSHGHTIFHYPERQFTVQIGDGAAIASITGYPVVSDVRAMDVSSGGQGAPIAPIADRYLLSEFDFCLNTGGIFNITYQSDKHSVALDITGANQILNTLANEMDLPYDASGAIARTGTVNITLLEQSNTFDYFLEEYPKSLDNQWVRENLTQLFKNFDAAVSDRLRTACEHIVFQTRQSVQQIFEKEKLPKDRVYKMIVTGGGAFNTFLMELLVEGLPEIQVVLPDKEMIENKEALLMALMGVMRIESVPNCIHTVTGAVRSVIGGVVHQGWQKTI